VIPRQEIAIVLDEPKQGAMAWYVGSWGAVEIFLIFLIVDSALPSVSHNSRVYEKGNRVSLLGPEKPSMKPHASV
jgi:hypothetical protein